MDALRSSEFLNGSSPFQCVSSQCGETSLLWFVLKRCRPTDFPFEPEEDAMHSSYRSKAALLCCLVVIFASAAASTAAWAKPEPGAKGRGFRMFARPLGALTINRVYCGLDSSGQVCVDSLGSSTI